MRNGFDNKKYIKLQSKKIKERIKMFDKLYLEIGGKLFDDSHASRVLPGFESDAKIQMLKELKIPLVAEDTGLNYGRTVILDCETGDFIIKAVGKPIKTI